MEYQTVITALAAATLLYVVAFAACWILLPNKRPEVTIGLGVLATVLAVGSYFVFFDADFTMMSAMIGSPLSVFANQDGVRSVMLYVRGVQAFHLIAAAIGLILAFYGWKQIKRRKSAIQGVSS